MCGAQGLQLITRNLRVAESMVCGPRNPGVPMLERLFQLKAHNTTLRTEVLAGLTTFLTMAYIIVVNPAILSAV